MRILILSACLAVSVSVSGATPKFRAVDVDPKIEIGYGITTADIDGDRKLDIVLCDKRHVVWYRNPSWERFVMAENLTPQDHVCVAATDVDGDGKAEVAVGAGWNPGDTVGSGAVFYLIPPADRTQRWTSVALPHEPTVHRMRWVPDAAGSFQLVVVPLHGRGNVNAEGAGVKIQSYRRPANPRDPWSIRTLNETLHKTHNFDAVQWDSDAAHELLIGGREGLYLWNDGSSGLTQIGSDANGGVGEVRRGRGADGATFVAAVSPMHGNQLVVFQPTTSVSSPGLWTRIVLDEALVDAHALACGDLMGQGRDQIVVGWRAMGKPAAVRVGIKLFYATSPKSGWESVLVDDNTMACEDLCLADLNGDGRLDIIAAGRATKNVKIYFNE